MSNMLLQRNPRRAADVVVQVPRQHFLKTIACFVINGLSRGKIRRANINMDSIQSLLEEYLPIISIYDQEDILHNLDKMQMIKDSLNSNFLPPLVHYKKAKTFEEMSILILEIAKDASDRARHDIVVSTMARETGRTNFDMVHPLHGLHRVDSTTTDWSDCTLPAATGEDASSMDHQEITTLIISTG